MKTLVVAGRYDQFRQFAQDEQLEPGVEAIYANSPSRLYGFRPKTGDCLEFVGDWWTRNDADQLLDVLASLGWVLSRENPKSTSFIVIETIKFPTFWQYIKHLFYNA